MCASPACGLITHHWVGEHEPKEEPLARFLGKGRPRPWLREWARLRALSETVEWWWDQLECDRCGGTRRVARFELAPPALIRGLLLCPQCGVLVAQLEDTFAEREELEDLSSRNRRGTPIRSILAIDEEHYTEPPSLSGPEPHLTICTGGDDWDAGDPIVEMLRLSIEALEAFEEENNDDWLGRWGP